MQKFLSQMTNVVFWSAFIISVINIFAGIIGLPQAIRGLSGLDIPSLVVIPLAIYIWWKLIISWLNALMGNSSGMVIYAANVLAAPFGYQLLGIPYEIGLIIAILPYPLFFWLQDLIDKAISLTQR